MPYIKQEDRAIYDTIFEELHAISAKGDLEYCIFRLMLKYMRCHDHNYTNLHDCTYAAMHCADEFRRRYLDKREDEARDINGDVE